MSCLACGVNWALCVSEAPREQLTYTARLFSRLPACLVYPSVDVRRTATAAVGDATSWLHSELAKNCPRSRIDVRPTTLPCPRTLDPPLPLPLAWATPRHTPRRSSSQLVTSLLKPTTTTINQYSLDAAVGSRVADLFLNSRVTLTYDLDFQFPANYGHGPQMCKRTKSVIRPVLEHCAPVWHYALTKAQSGSLEAVQKRAIHITHSLTRGMPYSSILFHANLDSLAARREDLSRRFSVILWIMPSVFTASFLHPDPPLSSQGSDLLKSFPKSMLVPSAIVLSYNMVLTNVSKPIFLPLSLLDCLINSYSI